MGWNASEFFMGTDDWVLDEIVQVKFRKASLNKPFQLKFDQPAVLDSIEIELIDQASRLVDQKWVEMAMIRFLAFPGGNAPFVEFMHPKLNPKVDYRGFTIQLQKFDEKKHTGVFKVTKQKRRMA